MSLQEYKKKRHFGVTAEPEGSVQKGPSQQRFVIQKHAASHLHYDFRLELEGVLKSWAVPKGPSYDPKDKRLAVHVEDHPIDYGTFEGIIPKGEYGGGTVMLWDQGTWESIGDPHQNYRKGRLKFMMHGSKLHGVWNLVRTGENWLLIKENDEYARPRSELDITLLDRSVTTGRSMEEIAGKADSVWHSKNEKLELDELPSHELPEKLTPQLATLVDDVPDGDQWLHEIKYDGYRILAGVERGKVRLLSRSGQDWSEKFPNIVQALTPLPITSAMLDGELVAASGSFQDLQNSLSGRPLNELVYYVFDLLFADGKDLRGLPLKDRKERLRTLLQPLPGNTVRYCDHIEGSGSEVLKQACQLGLEGVVSKRLDKPYESGRSRTWLKVKCANEDEFIIGGYTEPKNSREGFGSLVLGQYEGGKLIFAGKVGTGFDNKTLKSMHRKLQQLEVEDTPFDVLTGLDSRKGVHWVKPQLVARVQFTERTQEGILRHPSFQGLREDKPAKEVTQTAKALEVTVTSPDKIIDKSTKLTKLQLIEYYETVGEALLRHIKGRPLTLVRCPHGTEGKCFYQKHVREGFPDYIRSIPVEEDDGVQPYILVDDVKGLLALVQLGALEMHPWGSREEDIEKPDRLIFDVDPDPSVGWDRVIEAAVELKERLQILGLESYCKTTGGKGLHVVAPIRRGKEWPEVKAFCKALAESMEADSPSKYVSVMSKSERKGRIFVDYLRNGRNATAVCAYSVRSRKGAPVSTPLTWDEVTTDLDPTQFNVTTWSARHRREDEIWPDFFKIRQSLTDVMFRALKV